MMSDTMIDLEHEKNLELARREPKECIACGREATRTNNTLCQDHWFDAEGENNEN